jgi:hypothetical protein
MPDYTQDTERLVVASSVIVEATVSKLQSSNEPTVSASERLVVAQVNKVLRAGPALSKLTGQAVTIELAAEQRPKVGERVIFFTNGLVYGAQVVLREVAHREVTAQHEKDIAEAIEAVPVRHLEGRLETTEFVIVGMVRHLRPSGLKEPTSFHSPKWMVAEVSVSNWLKGTYRDGQIEVLFPSARDVFWAGAHRFHPGEEGIFLLRKGFSQWGAPPEANTALDPADFQPMDALPRVRSLLRHNQ